MTEIKFTKKQQQLIDRCQGRLKQTMIDSFIHIQQMKQMPEVKAYNKQLRAEIKSLQA
jgi:hypothetical protein